MTGEGRAFPVFFLLYEFKNIFNDVKTIGKHINNALKEELENSVVAKFATTAADGKTYQTDHYNLDMIISVGYRAKSQRGASNYWAKLKERLKAEGAIQLLTNCQQLKMTATDGKKRLTDVATTEQLLRLVQSIPSKKAEPFKLWLAQVGRERIEETVQKMVVGGYDEAGNPDPHCIMIVLKDGQYGKVAQWKSSR